MSESWRHFGGKMRGWFSRLRRKGNDSSRRRRLLLRLAGTGLVLLFLSGFVRDRLGLSEPLSQGLALLRSGWRQLLQAVAPVAWLVEVFSRGLDCFLVFGAGWCVANSLKRVPSYLDAIVLLRLNLRLGVIWSSNWQLSLLLSLPASLAFCLSWTGPESLYALAFSLVTLWYLGVAINPRSATNIVEIMNRALVGRRGAIDDLAAEGMDDDAEVTERP